MKKLFLLAALAGILLAGCNKDENNNEHIGTWYPVLSSVVWTYTLQPGASLTAADQAEMEEIKEYMVTANFSSLQKIVVREDGTMTAYGKDPNDGEELVSDIKYKKEGNKLTPYGEENLLPVYFLLEGGQLVYVLMAEPDEFEDIFSAPLAAKLVTLDIRLKLKK